MFGEEDIEAATLGPIDPLDEQVRLNLLENLCEEQAEFIGRGEDAGNGRDTSCPLSGHMDFCTMYRIQCVVSFATLSYDVPKAYICF